MVVSGVYNALTVLGCALLACLLFAMHNPGFYDRKRASNGCLCLLHSGLPLLVVAQLDWASVWTVLLQVVPVWFDNISASYLTVEGWGINQRFDLLPSGDIACFLSLRGSFLPDVAADVCFLLFNDVVKLLFQCFSLLGVFFHLWNALNLITSLNINVIWLTWFLEIGSAKTVNAHFSATRCNFFWSQIGNKNPIWSLPIGKSIPMTSSLSPSKRIVKEGPI